MLRKLSNILKIRFEAGLLVGFVILAAPIFLVIFTLLWPFLYLQDRKYKKQFAADLRRVEVSYLYI